jgi:succinate-acetate transporter protein
MPKEALGAALGITLIAWAIFTVIMTYLSFMTKNRTVQTIFVLLSLLFILLVIAHYTENTAIKVFAGYEGIATAISAWYGMFEIIKGQFSDK